MADGTLALLDPDATRRVLDYVRRERRLQDEKWGDQGDRNPMEWVAILTEEVGEVAKDALTYWFGAFDPLGPAALYKMRAELIQVAAVAAAAIQFLEARLDMCHTGGLTEVDSYNVKGEEAA